MWINAHSPEKQASYRVTSAHGKPAPINFNALELLSIFNHDQQITVVDRFGSADITKYLESVAPLIGHGFQLTMQAGESVSDHVLEQHLLPKYAGYEYLLEDLELLAQLYLDLMGCPRIGMRLKILQAAMCPKFHVDRTSIRLVCTYMGPGTEWLDDGFADRSQLESQALRQTNIDVSLLQDQKGLHQVPTFAITLLKGSLWQGNASRGVVHRSPAVSQGQTRVMLAIDALW